MVVSTSSSVGSGSGLSATRNNAATCLGARRVGEEVGCLEVLDGTYGASNKDEPPGDRALTDLGPGLPNSDATEFSGAAERAGTCGVRV